MPLKQRCKNMAPDGTCWCAYGLSGPSDVRFVQSLREILMAEYDRSTPEHRSSGTGNTAIVAIVVVLLLAVIAFFIFLRPGQAPVETDDGPDIELEVNPPEDALPEPGGGDTGEEGGGEADGAPDPST